MSDESPAAQAGAEPPRRRLGCLFYSACAAFVLALVLAVSYGLWQSRAANELAAEIKRIQGRGEPVWFADLAPGPFDPAADGTQLYLAAVAKLAPSSQAFYDLISADPKPQPGKYSVLEDVLESNRPARELLAQAVRKSHFRLPLDYTTTQPMLTMLEPIQKARDFSWLLHADVLQSIGEGDNDRAVAADLDGLLLSEMLRDEPFLITQLVRIAIAGSACGGLQTTVAHIDLTPGQFAVIDDQLALMEGGFRLGPSVQGERASLLTTMHFLSENAEGFDEVMDGGSGAARVLGSGALRPLRLYDEAFMLRMMSRHAATVDTPGPEGIEANRAVESEIVVAKVGFKHILTTLLAPAVLQAREAGIRHRQRLIGARLGLRVARYFADQGRFPDTLDAVTDAKLPAVPVDLYSARPLVYRATGHGFTIYSVGENGVDDGGGERPDRQEHFSRFEVEYSRLTRVPEKPDN